MDHRLRIVTPLLFAAALTGCQATVGVSHYAVPPDAATQCVQHCESIGLPLGAVAIMANNVGCVCDAARGQHVTQSSSITAGMATIAMQATAQQRHQQQ